MKLRSAQNRSFCVRVNYLIKGVGMYAKKSFLKYLLMFMILMPFCSYSAEYLSAEQIKNAFQYLLIKDKLELVNNSFDNLVAKGIPLAVLDRWVDEVLEIKATAAAREIKTKIQQRMPMVVGPSEQNSAIYILTPINWTRVI